MARKSSVESGENGETRKRGKGYLMHTYSIRFLLVQLPRKRFRAGFTGNLARDQSASGFVPRNCIDNRMQCSIVWITLTRWENKLDRRDNWIVDDDDSTHRVPWCNGRIFPIASRRSGSRQRRQKTAEKYYDGAIYIVRYVTANGNV